MLLVQVCKNTLGHDGHRAVELSDQARKDSDYIRALNENAEKSVEQILQKVNNIRIEEQILIRVRKDIHKVSLVKLCNKFLSLPEN